MVELRKRLHPADRREQIMEAALTVFGQKGFTETSNRDIACEAGLKSTALIYHYFPSKFDLLRSIAEKHSPLAHLYEDRESFYEQPPVEALTEIGTLYMSLFGDPKVRPFMRLLLGEALRNKELADTFAACGPLRMIGLVSGYLEKQMDLGIFRRMDPESAARSFLGPFMSLFMLRMVLHQSDELPTDPATFVKQNVELFLHGIAL